MAVELADIFRQYGPAYRQKYASPMPASHLQAMRAIEHCRTAALGGQVYRCPNCEQLQYSYHSCRNRHCPKCQHEKAQDWLEQQRELLLPVPYFLLTCTMPAGLNDVARSHQKLFYTCTWCRCKCDLLFKTSAAATQQLAQEPRWLGGQLGLVGVLHTWGRNLAYPPHIHYLVPAGAVTDDEKIWVPARQNFLLPVRALSRVFRSKLQQALRDTPWYARIPTHVWQQEWVVHCEGVGCGLNALKYLAPYIFRVAISNHRLLKLEGDRVTFRYRATETGAEKRCTLGAEEFIHRFLQPVLPKGFVKVRSHPTGSFEHAPQPPLTRCLACGPNCHIAWLACATSPSNPLSPLRQAYALPPDPASLALSFSMNPVPTPRFHQTSLTAPSRLPVRSDSSAWSHHLILPSSLCKNNPFACTIPVSMVARVGFACSGQPGLGL